MRKNVIFFFAVPLLLLLLLAAAIFAFLGIGSDRGGHDPHHYIHLLPLTAAEDASGVTIDRSILLELAWESDYGSGTTSIVRDSYRLTNTTGEAKTLRLVYPVAAYFREKAPVCDLTLQIDGDAAPTLYPGSFLSKKNNYWYCADLFDSDDELRDELTGLMTAKNWDSVLSPDRAAGSDFTAASEAGHRQKDKAAGQLWYYAFSVDIPAGETITVEASQPVLTLLGDPLPSFGVSAETGYGAAESTEFAVTCADCSYQITEQNLGIYTDANGETRRTVTGGEPYAYLYVEVIG